MGAPTNFCDWLLACIIAAFAARDNIMEAEQLNALTNQMQDLRSRTAELRGYL